MKKILLAMIMWLVFSTQALALTSTQKEEIYNNAVIMIECGAFYEGLSEIASRAGFSDEGQFFNNVRNGYRLAGKMLASIVVKESDLEFFVENIYESSLTVWRVQITPARINNNDPVLLEQKEICNEISELQSEIIAIMRKEMYMKDD